MITVLDFTTELYDYQGRPLEPTFWMVLDPEDTSDNIVGTVSTRYNGKTIDPRFVIFMDSQGNRLDYPVLQVAGLPSALGVPSRGTSSFASRSDHVHLMPVANDIVVAPQWGGAITRLVQDKLRDFPHVYDLPVSIANRDDAGFDWAVPINAAFAANFNQRFVIPNVQEDNTGKIRTRTPIVLQGNGSGLIGQGNSLILSMVDTGDIIQIPEDGIGSSNIHMSDLTVWSNVAKIAGYALYGRKVTDAEFINVKFGSVDTFVADGRRLYKGVWLDGISQLVFFDGEMSGATNELLILNGLLDGLGNQIYAAECSLLGGIRFTQSLTWAIRVAGAIGGFRFIHADISDCRNGMIVDKTITAGTNREVFFGTDGQFDNLSGSAFVVKDGSLAYLRGNGVWASGCGRTGEWVFDIENATGPAAPCATQLGTITLKDNFGDGYRQRGGTFVGATDAQNNGNGSAVMGASIAGGDAFDFDNMTCVFITGKIGGTGNATKGTALKLGAGVSFSFSAIQGFSNGIATYTNANALSASQVYVRNPEALLALANTWALDQTVSSGANLGVVLHAAGGMEVVAANPYVDFKALSATDFDVRVVSVGTVLAVQSSANSILDLASGTGALRIGGTKVVGPRDTGWTASTGTANKGAYATYSTGTASAAYVQAELQTVMDALQAASRRLKAVEDAARTHGLIN